jgi:Uma2 family endonuclease
MMTTTAVLPTLAPERIKMSYAAYLGFAGDAEIVEWVDGEVIIHMPPTYEHQDIAAFLVALLRSFVNYFELGVVIAAPFEVKLWPDGPAREPDILFVSNARKPQLTKQRLEGAPDLAVEIISPGSATEDRVRKFAEYQQAGVREYWLIDPRPYQQQVDFYARSAEGEFEPAAPDANGRFHSTILPHFWLDAAWFRQEALPNPQQALAAVMLAAPDLPDDVRQAYQTLYEALSQP